MFTVQYIFFTLRLKSKQANMIKTHRKKIYVEDLWVYIYFWLCSVPPWCLLTVFVYLINTVITFLIKYSSGNACALNTFSTFWSLLSCTATGIHYNLQIPVGSYTCFCLPLAIISSELLVALKGHTSNITARGKATVGKGAMWKYGAPRSV